MSILFHKRPDYVSKYDGPLSQCARKGGTGQDCSTAAIPSELSFEKVVCNKCLPPCSLQDFLDYLSYVTHDAENLQFYLWMVDYSQRFRQASKAEKALSPKWRSHRARIGRTDDCVADDPLSSLDARNMDIHSEDISDGSTWDGTQSESTVNCTHPLKSSNLSVLPHNLRKGSNTLQWQNNPDIQPFRAEINRVVTHYITPGSPRQLNFSHNDRANVLQALQHTTHPSALTVVKRILDSTLRNQSHPNFIRWSICNGNIQWTWALRIFAIINIFIGFGVAITLTLSKYSRWWRIFAALEWWFGITNIIAASQGLCVLLHRMHTRQYHAWEMQDSTKDDDKAMLKGPDINFIHYESTKSKWPVKMETFGPTNDYSGEPWVDRYHRKSWFRKLFEKRVIVQEASLKAIQNRVTRQAEAWALIITIPLTIGFVAIPNGNLYPN